LEVLRWTQKNSEGAKSKRRMCTNQTGGKQELKHELLLLARALRLNVQNEIENKGKKNRVIADA
jgi:hypothetical protein